MGVEPRLPRAGWVVLAVAVAGGVLAVTGARLQLHAIPLFAAFAGFAWWVRREGSRDAVVLSAFALHFLLFDICYMPDQFDGLALPLNIAWATQAAAVLYYLLSGGPGRRARFRHDPLLHFIVLTWVATCISLLVSLREVSLSAYDFHTVDGLGIGTSVPVDVVKTGLLGLAKNAFLYYVPLFLIAARTDGDRFYAKLMWCAVAVGCVHVIYSVCTMAGALGLFPASLLPIRLRPPEFIGAVFDLATRARGLFWNPNTLGAFLLYPLTFLLGRIFLAPERSRVCWLALIPVSVGIVLTGSRLAVGSAVLILLVLAALARRWRVVAAICAILALGLGAIALFLNLEWITSRLTLDGARTIGGDISRKLSRAQAWVIAKDHVVWGVGAGLPVAVDGDYIMLLLRGGLLGLVARLALTGAIIARAWSAFRRSRPGGRVRELAACVLCLALAALVQDYFAGSFHTAPILLFSMCLVGCMISAWHAERAEAASDIPGWLVEQPES